MSNRRLVSSFITKTNNVGKMATKKLNIFLHSMDGTGHLNATIGLGQELANRGHQVSFLLNEAFKGQASAFGLRELHLIDKPKPIPVGATDPTVNPIKLLGEQLQKSGLLTGASSLEKMKLLFANELVEDMYQRTVVFNPQIGKFIAQEKPDLIILDQPMLPPAIAQSGIPYVLIISGNPLMVYNSEQLPPAFSGYSTKSDPATWVEYFGKLRNGALESFGTFQSRLNDEFAFKATEEIGRNYCGFVQSPYLNIYGYPEELDYQDLVPLPENVISVDAFCRKLPKPFKIPEELQVKPNDKLIYVSMGSMGSIDVELNKRIASALAKTPYKVIFSKGPLADEYELPDNCWGEAHLPQTSILPLVDLCITHGGNNTVTETFSFGVPMIVLPLFGDQFDNAQRIQEKGFGVRLEPYDFTEKQLLEAVNTLINDKALKQRLKTAAKRIESSNSKQKACEQLERLVEESPK